MNTLSEEGLKYFRNAKWALQFLGFFNLLACLSSSAFGSLQSILFYANAVFVIFYFFLAWKIYHYILTAIFLLSFSVLVYLFVVFVSLKLFNHFDPLFIAPSILVLIVASVGLYFAIKARRWKKQTASFQETDNILDSNMFS